jgi:threonine/homoserine/homoserine lactone efflux protein
MSLLHSPLYLGFIAASLALIAMPGPNTTLIVGNTIAYGTIKGLVTLAGTSSALVIQLALIIFGLTETMAALATWFDRLRWLGVAYLVYLGLRQWLAKPAPGDGTEIAAAARSRRLYWQGFGVCLTNPKTLAFFAAFLPQFVEPARPILPQLLVLGVTFMALAIPGDTGFCLVAGRIRPWIVGPRFARLRNRISGTCLLICGVGLALARRS